MKTHIYLCALLLLLAAACNTTDNQVANKQSQTVFAPDSLWTPTGDAKLDSLLQLAAVAPQDTSLALLYDEIGGMYQNNDFEKAKEYYIKLGALSELLDWNKGHYRYAYGISNILIRERLADSAVVVLQKALELARREKDESWTTNLLLNIGAANYFKNWYEMALRYYMEALPYHERTNNSEKLIKAYYTISQIYTNINAVDKAIEYGQKAVALDKENVFALCALARAYSNDREFEKAKGYLEEAIRLSELQNNLFMMGNIYFSLADDAIAAFDLENADKYANQSLEINRQFGRTSCVGNFVLSSKLEMLKGNYAQSKAYAKEALDIADELDLLEIKRFCYTMLAELAMAQGNNRENMLYWDKRDFVEKAIARETTLRAAEEMAAKYETEKKQLEIERQQSVIDRHNMERWLLAAGVAVCVAFLALLWYMLRLRNRRNLALTERNSALAERTEALSEMNTTKDKFLNIISHDLKNPTHALHDNLKLLAQNIRLWDADMLSDFSNELLKSSEGQVELLNSLLSWARIQTGRITCNPVAFDLVARLRTDVALVRKLADNKQITLHAQMPDDATVTADANMILTVVRNLLTNAVKFTPAGGTVRLDVSPSGGGGYTVSVTDNGTGMTSEQIENLFRLDKHHTSRGTAGEEGSGLGLIVCKELLGMHGSALHVESGEGSGSRFWFEVISQIFTTFVTKNR